MKKKIYIIDWDETITKTKTGGLVVDESSQEQSFIKKNIRFLKRTRKWFEKIRQENHFIVLIGRKQCGIEDNFLHNEDLAIRYMDVLLGKKRNFLKKEDVYLYDGQNKQKQSNVIDAIILRFNLVYHDSYIMADDFNRVVLVGYKSTYSEAQKKGYSFINTDVEETYLTQLENDSNEISDTHRKDVNLANKNSLWQNHQTKILTAAIATTTTILGVLVGLALTLTSLIFPPLGIVGGLLIGAFVGFAMGAAISGTAYCCTRNRNSQLILQKISGIGGNLSRIVTDTIVNSVRNEVDLQESMHLLNTNNRKYASDDIGSCYGSPITSQASHLGISTNRRNEIEVNSDRKEELVTDDSRLLEGEFPSFEKGF